MKFRSQIRQTLAPLLGNQGIFNTGYTLDEIEDELNRRDKAIQRVERKTDKYHKRKKKCLQKAASSKNQRKLRFVAKAKEAEMYKSFFAELFDNLMAQQLFLTKLSLKAKRRSIFQSPMEEFGFNVDIGGMNQDAVTDALQRSSFEQDNIQNTIEDVQMEFETMEDDGLSLDLDELKDEADMLEASDIESDSVDLGSSFNEAIDSQIEEELDQLEDEFNTDGTGGSAAGD